MLDKIKKLIGDQMLVLTDDEINRYTQKSLANYSKKHPLKCDLDIKTNSGIRDYALPLSWDMWRFRINHVEYPAGEKTPVFLAQDKWMIYKDIHNSVILRLLCFIQEEKIIRLEYFRDFTNKDLHMIPNDHIDAFSALVAACCCRALSRYYLASKDNILANDFTEKSKSLIKQANKTLDK